MIFESNTSALASIPVKTHHHCVGGFMNQSQCDKKISVIIKIRIVMVCDNSHFSV